MSIFLNFDRDCFILANSANPNDILHSGYMQTCTLANCEYPDETMHTVNLFC